MKICTTKKQNTSWHDRGFTTGPSLPGFEALCEALYYCSWYWCIFWNSYMFNLIITLQTSTLKWTEALFDCSQIMLNCCNLSPLVLVLTLKIIPDLPVLQLLCMTVSGQTHEWRMHTVLQQRWRFLGDASRWSSRYLLQTGLEPAGPWPVAYGVADSSSWGTSADNSLLQNICSNEAPGSYQSWSSMSCCRIRHFEEM